MVNVLQLCVRYPPAPGGAETHVRSLSEELQRLGHRVEIFTSDLYKEFPFKKLVGPTDQNNIKRHRAYTLGGNLHYTFFPSLIPSMLKRDFDIYHAHSYGYFHVNVSAFVKNLKDTPFVITPHFHPEWSMWGGESRKKIRGIYDSLIAQSVIDSADAVIGVSRNEISLLSKRLDVPDSKVSIIPNGIYPEKFTPIPHGDEFRSRFDIREKMVLYTGRLASNKGLLTLVESIPSILKENPDTTFVIIGEDEGMQEEILKRAGELDVHSKLKMIGYISDYDLFKTAYSAADVFVLPSEYEAFGIVLLEAMMCETPCVATRVGGVPEVVEDGKTGMLVEYADPAGLADSVNVLLQNKAKRKKMGRAGRKRVLQKFTWSKVAKRVNSLYNKLL